MKKTPKFTVQLIAAIAVLLALNFAIDKFTVGTETFKVSFTFIPNTVIGSLAGPWLSFIIFGVWDVVSFALSGSGQSFIVWFTLIEALEGLLYGAFFYGKKLDINNPKDWGYTTIAVLVLMGMTTFTLTPLALSTFYDIPLATLYATRVWKPLEIPVRVIITLLVLPKLQQIPELRKIMGLKK